MVKVYGVFDLDGVLFDHKGMHALFLRDVFRGDERALRVIQGFEKSSSVYISDYLIDGCGSERDYFLSVVKKTFSLKDKDEYSSVKEFLYRSFRDFSDTQYFFEMGAIPEMIDANRAIVRTAMNLGVDYEGVVCTSRAHSMDDVDLLYNDCHKRTVDWLSMNDSLINRVFYHKNSDKHKVLDQLSDGVPAFMVEDHAHSLERFLMSRVPCVLVNSTGKEDSHADRLVRSYPERMFIYNNHSDAGVKLEELFEAAARK